MRALGFLSFLMGAFLMAGCAAGNKSVKADTNWLSQKWVLKQLHNGGTEVPVKNSDESVAFVQFVIDENTFNGNAGCNNFFGAYQLSDEGNLQFGAAGMTRKMCSPESMAIEDAFVKLFAEDIQANVSIVDGQLILDNNTIKAVFVAE